jgi:hypothetical protein
MGWFLTTALVLGSAILAYLVLFFISTERGNNNEVLLRRRSSFWWVKYGAYFPFALLKEMFDTPVMRSKEYNWGYVNTLCENYADRPMSLCKTFWVSLTLLTVFCPVSTIGFSVFGIIVVVATLIWFILVGIGLILEFLVWPFKKIFFDLPKKLIDNYKERHRKEWESTVAPASTLTFYEAYVATKKGQSPGRGLVQLEEFFDLYYSSESYPGEFLKIIEAVKAYQTAYKKKTRISEKKKQALIFNIMDSLCTFLRIYWEVTYSKNGLVTELDWSRRPFKFLGQLATYVKLGKYFSGKRPFRFEEDLIRIFDVNLKLEVKLRDQYLDDKSDYFDPEYEETDMDAYENYLSTEANKLQNELEKTWLQNEYEIFFEQYKEFILTFFGDKVETSGMADIERKIVAKRKFDREQELLGRKAEEEEKERQRAIEKEKDARRQHYIDLLTAFFSKVCPIIRVKQVEKS